MIPVLKQLFDLVSRAEVAGFKLAELAANELAAYLGYAVYEHMAFQMVQFMLHHTASETIKAFGYSFSLLVDVLYGYAFRAGDVAVDVRNAKAAL